LEEERPEMNARKLDLLLLSCTVSAMPKPGYISGYHESFFSQISRYGVRTTGSDREIFLAKIAAESLYHAV
jgi:hypothetical protein